jgi:hypothetical protein
MLRGVVLIDVGNWEAVVGSIWKGGMMMRCVGNDSMVGGNGEVMVGNIGDDVIVGDTGNGGVMAGNLQRRSGCWAHIRPVRAD